MDHAFPVCRFQRPANLQDYSRGFLGLQFPLLTQNRAKILAFQVFHRDEFETVRLPQIKDSNHIAMRDLSSKDQFLFEPLEYFWIGRKFRANNFQCHHAFQLGVMRFVNSAHSALSQQRQDFVTVTENGARLKFSIRYRRRGRASIRNRPARRGER